MPCDAPIDAKTAAGLAEVATRSARLTMTQRRLFIMADSKRGPDADSLALKIEAARSAERLVPSMGGVPAGHDYLRLPETGKP